MTFSTSYRYQDRRIFDINTFIEAIRLIIINSILAFIFLFLILEEVDWAIFSFKGRINDQIIDNTSWNIKSLI